jgi:hypothetical protein
VKVCGSSRKHNVRYGSVRYAVPTGGMFDP